MTARVLVAGIGNIFLSDDGFGVEVVRRLVQRELPADVEVVDIGIRGMHLAYQLLDGYKALLIIDAAPRGGQPGDLYVIEPDLASIPEDDGSLLNAHGMQPDAVLSLIKTMARDYASPDDGAVHGIERVLVVGCEPETVDEGMGLSPPVAAAVDAAVDMVLRVLDTELRDTLHDTTLHDTTLQDTRCRGA
ncbi:MAG: hydrogenase maturation protease [Actinomycetota bacterium]|nr:hydrogenase maturation protease [Actinomycetota bacterium]